MTPEQTQTFLDLLKQSESDRAERLYSNLESHLAASDRVIGQAAQLKLLNEGDGLSAAALALVEAAKSGSPL